MRFDLEKWLSDNGIECPNECWRGYRFDRAQNHGYLYAIVAAAEAALLAPSPCGVEGHRMCDCVFSHPIARAIVETNPLAKGMRVKEWICTHCQELSRVRQQERAAALEQAADKLRKVSAGYLASGHSHRAQMLEALAKEIEYGASSEGMKQESPQAETPQVAEGQAGQISAPYRTPQVETRQVFYDDGSPSRELELIPAEAQGGPTLEDAWDAKDEVIEERMRVERIVESRVSEHTKRLREALLKLANEVSGVLSLEREGIRALIGNTNLAVLEQRLTEARALESE